MWDLRETAAQKPVLTFMETAAAGKMINGKRGKPLTAFDVNCSDQFIAAGTEQVRFFSLSLSLSFSLSLSLSDPPFKTGQWSGLWLIWGIFYPVIEQWLQIENTLSSFGTFSALS